MASRSKRVRAIAAAATLVLIVALVATATLGALRKRDRVVAGAKSASNLQSTAATSSPSVNVQRSELGVARAERETTPMNEFDAAAALADVRALEALGVRAGGTPAEAQAAAYISDRLGGMGLDPLIEEFPLPNGTTSRNVVVLIPGSSEEKIVLGAHMDTKSPSPGANDNGTGCGALLQIAAALAVQPVAPTVEIVFFGSEETIGKDPTQHHFGSRYRVSQMSAAERATTAGMISVDMIGFGSELHSRTMGKGPLTLSDLLVAHAGSLGIGMTYLKDTGASGWSDHEAYELAGIPVSWIEWRDDPVYHTAADTSGHVLQDHVDTVGRLVLSFLRSLDSADLGALASR